MITIFNPPFDWRRTPIILPMYANVLPYIRGEYDKVQKYYIDNYIVAPNTNVFVKLLVEFNSYLDRTPENLVAYIRAETPRLCRAYNFNSSMVDSGYTNNGNLYNNLCPEVFISTEYDFNIPRCIRNWKDLEPLRIVSHPFTDVNCQPVMGKYRSNQRGIVVATIDIALLALQYQQWMSTERYNLETDTYIPLHRFVVKYLLNNALSTHVDVAIFNRLLYKVKDLTIPSSHNTHSFQVIDYGSRLDQCHDQLLTKLNKSKTDWVQRLDSIPSLKYGSYWRAITYPDTAPTRNIKWALILSKINTLELLLELDRVTESESININDRISLSRDISYTFNSKMSEMYLTSSFKDKLKQIMSQTANG